MMQAAAGASGRIEWDGAALDTTHVKVRRSVAGVRKTFRPKKMVNLTDERLGDTRRCHTSQTHLCGSPRAPLSFVITAGQRSYAANIGTVLDPFRISPKARIFAQRPAC